MKYITTILTLLLFSTLLLSTEVSAQTEITKEDIQDIVQRHVVVETRTTEIIGSPYFHDAFTTGYVTLFNNDKTETLTMNYNIYENRIEYSDGNTILAIDGNQIKEFIFNHNGTNQTFRKGYSARGLDANEFVQVMVDGPAKLLVKNEVSYLQDVSSYGTATQRDEYVSNTRVYVHIDGETDRIRRLRERSVLRSFDSHREQLEQYTNENNLDLSELEHVKRLFDYYNSLI